MMFKRRRFSFSAHAGKDIHARRIAVVLALLGLIAATASARWIWFEGRDARIAGSTAEPVPSEVSSTRRGVLTGELDTRVDFRVEPGVGGGAKPQ
jgi:hypothetical protein